MYSVDESHCVVFKISYLQADNLLRSFWSNFLWTDYCLYINMACNDEHNLEDL